MERRCKRLGDVVGFHQLRSLSPESLDRPASARRRGHKMSMSARRVRLRATLRSTGVRAAKWVLHKMHRDPRRPLLEACLCTGVKQRALPLLKTPLAPSLVMEWSTQRVARPRLCAAASLVGSGPPTVALPVARSTMCFAHWFRSRGRLGCSGMQPVQ